MFIQQLNMQECWANVVRVCVYVYVCDVCEFVREGMSCVVFNQEVRNWKSEVGKGGALKERGRERR